MQSGPLFFYGADITCVSRNSAMATFRSKAMTAISSLSKESPASCRPATRTARAAVRSIAVRRQTVAARHTAYVVIVSSGTSTLPLEHIGECAMLQATTTSHPRHAHVWGQGCAWILRRARVGQRAAWRAGSITCAAKTKMVHGRYRFSYFPVHIIRSRAAKITDVRKRAHRIHEDASAT